MKSSDEDTFASFACENVPRMFSPIFYHSIHDKLYDSRRLKIQKCDTYGEKNAPIARP